MSHLLPLEQLDRPLVSTSVGFRIGGLRRLGYVFGDSIPTWLLASRAQTCPNDVGSKRWVTTCCVVGSCRVEAHVADSNQDGTVTGTISITASTSNLDQTSTKPGVLLVLCV